MTERSGSTITQIIDRVRILRMAAHETQDLLCIAVTDVYLVVLYLTPSGRIPHSPETHPCVAAC